MRRKLLCGVALVPASASAQVAETSLALGRVGLALLFVVALILALAWLSKRSALFKLATQKKMYLVSSLSLSAREKVVMLRVGNRCLLLGVASGGVTLLREFSPEECDPSSAGDDGENTFSARLKKILESGEGK